MVNRAKPPRWVFDLEADGLLEEATQLWCAVFKEITTGEIREFAPLTDEKVLEEFLGFMDEIPILIGHNAISYDLPLLEKLHGYKYRGKVVDTLLMSRLQSPHRKAPFGCRAGPNSVEAWGFRFNRHKPEHEDWSQFSPEMLHRCREDVEIQERILYALLEEGKGGDWKSAHKLTFDLFRILQKQEEYGWLVDAKLVHKHIGTLTHWMDRIDRVVTPRLPMLCIRPKKTKDQYAFYRTPYTKAGKLQGYVLNWLGTVPADSHLHNEYCIGGPLSCVDFRRVDLGSNAEVKDYLLSEGWVPAVWNTNDAGERTSPKLSGDDPFEGVNGKIGRLIAKRVVLRHRRSQLEGWLKVIRPDGRISQGIGGIASTGRLTHRRIVNVPGNDVVFGKQMRQIFVAKPGYKIVGVDSAGCQNRMLAGRVGDPEFTKTLVDGKKEDQTSIHFVNQAAITKIAGFTPSYKICKNLNYAFLFGASDKKLATTAGVAIPKGELIRKALLSVSPGLERLVNDLLREWRSTAKKRKGRFGVEYYNGTIKGLDGRPVLIESEHCILVYMLQSDEAIMMQYAVVFLEQSLSDLGWEHGREYGFVANVHDEIQAEVREDLVDVYSELATRAITYAGEYLQIACPHLGEAEVGNNWYETH